MSSALAPQSPGMPVLLSIAGSDSGGGAGIQADLKTFEAHGSFGTSVLTAVTAQNTRGVTGIHPVPLAMVRAQAEAVFTDFPVAAVKIGMLADADIVATVADLLRTHARGLPVVLDPVMVATSGDLLLQPSAVDALRRVLFPLATVITPNAHEAAHLSGMPVHTPDEAQAAAAHLAQAAPEAWILVKGAHLQQAAGQVRDTLYHRGSTWHFDLPLLDNRNTHGTGCTLSAAIAARLAQGLPVPQAVRLAKAYVHAAIAQAPGLGGGHGPLRHQIALPQ